MTPAPEIPTAPQARPPVYRWYHRLAALVFANFCFLVGILLVVFPWLEWWEGNYFSDFGPQWRQVWLNPYLRGAVSGIGLVDLYISFVEIFRLRRFLG